MDGVVAVQEEHPVRADAVAAARMRQASVARPSLAGHDHPLGREAEAARVEGAVRRRPEDEIDLVGVQVGDEAQVAEQRQDREVADETDRDAASGPANA